MENKETIQEKLWRESAEKLSGALLLLLEKIKDDPRFRTPDYDLIGRVVLNAVGEYTVLANSKENP